MCALILQIGSFSKEDELTLTSAPIFYNDLQKPTTLSEMFPYKIHCSYFGDVCSDVCHVSTPSTKPTTEGSTEAMTDEKENGRYLFCVIEMLKVSKHQELIMSPTASNGSGHAKMCLMPYVNNKGADQPAHPRSLISTFIVLCLDSMYTVDLRYP